MADISNSKSNTVVTGTSDADSIRNRSPRVTINALGGNDTIDNYFAGDYTRFVSINAGAGNDSVYSSGDNVTIDGGDGKDTVSSYGDSVSINGGTGNDCISNSYDSNVTIDGGTGNDEITSEGSKNSINAGAGDDLIDIISGEKITIDAGDGNDYVSNLSASQVTINGGAGNDSIENYHGFVNGGSGDDFISGSGTINGGADDDTISGSGIIDGGTGNDKIYGDGSVNGGAGDDTIDCSLGYSLTIAGGKGNDSILLDWFTSDRVIKYNSGDGNDTVSGFNDTSTLSVSGGYSTQVSGNDIIVTVGKGTILLSGTAHLPYININGTLVNAGKTINNTVSNKTINGTNANDSIKNSGSKVKINGFAGNDTVYTTGNAVTIEGGDGNDRLENSGAKVSIYGGDGNDNIANIGENVTITGGEGNDDFLNYGNSVSINGGNGNDSVTNAYNNNVSIYGGAGADSIYNVSSSRVTINGGADNDTIDNGGERISINGGTGNDSISGYNDYSTIVGGAGNDIIVGNHFRTKIYGGAGNDSINIGDHWGNTISGGDGADIISVAGGGEHSINGGAGNDRISLGSAYATVSGGAGDDIIYGSTMASRLYQYDSGNDTIYGWSSNDTLTIPGGSFSYKVSGSNGIVTVADSGKITLVGAKGKTVNINGKNYANATNVFTPQDVIKSFMGSLDTTEASGVYALDEAVSVASGGYFKSIQSAINQMVADVESYNDGDKFLREKCGIILGNDDTGAITGSDAGGSITKTATSVVPESGTVNNFTDNTFTTNGLKVYLSTFNAKNYSITKINYSDLNNDKQRYIWQALQTCWAGNSLDLIAESYGDNFGFSSKSSATVNDIYFGFVKDDNDTALATTWTWGGYADAYKLAMTVNMKYYDGLTVGNLDGQSSSTSAYLDRTLAHEFTHAVMSANITGVDNLPQFIKEGAAELTHGIDDHHGTRISALSNDASRLNTALDLTNTKTGTADAYAGGYMFLRYLAKQASENYTYVNPLNSAVANKSVAQTSISAADTTTVKGALLTLADNFPDDSLYLSDYASTVKNVNAKALTKPIMIIGNTSANSIATGSGNDTVFANTGNDKIIGGNGNDYLGGEAGNDSLNGGAGDDTLIGGTGNDTLTGGTGKDLFVHVADTDFITDYAAGQDKIKLTEGKIVGLSLSNSNLVMDIGTYGSVTVKNGIDKKITVIDANDTETTIVGTAYDDTAAAKVTLASGVMLGDASSRTKAIRIVGNALDNTILGGANKDIIYGKDGDDYLEGNNGNDRLSGQNGDDTLSGGKGNDTLTGGAGNDLFIYSAGNDIITDYAAGDKISLGAALSSATVDGSDAVLTVGKGSVTVKNERYLTIIDKAGKELTTIVGGIIYDDSSAAKVTLASGIAVGDASSRTKATRIVGNALDNSILGGAGNDIIYGKNGDDYLEGNAGNDLLSGYTGNDTLWGGSGNDTLTGGAGADTFIYTTGKDVITDFGDDDLLQITGTFSGTYNKSANTIAFKVGSTANALTLKDFTATTFNVNGNDYRISGTKLVK